MEHDAHIECVETLLVCIIEHTVFFCIFFFFFQAEDGIRDYKVTGVQTCALPIRWICSFSRTMSVREIVGESSSSRPLPGFFPNRTSWLNSSRSRKMSTWNRFWPS